MNLDVITCLKYYQIFGAEITPPPTSVCILIGQWVSVIAAKVLLIKTKHYIIWNKISWSDSDYFSKINKQRGSLL
jgi:hypothetical protein